MRNSIKVTFIKHMMKQTKNAEKQMKAGRGLQARLESIRDVNDSDFVAFIMLFAAATTEAIQ